VWETVDDDFSGLLLQSTSPAVDKGLDQFTAADGELIPPRPITGYIGAAPDLGWREFGSPVMITPTASPIPSPTFAISPTPLPTMTFTLTAIPPTPTVVSLTPLPTATPVTPTPALPTITLTSPPSLPTITLTPSPSLPTVTFTPATPQLSIIGITPNSAQANTTVNVTLTGTGFANGATVRFEGVQGTAPQVTGIEVVNANTIVIAVNTATGPGATTQVWDVRVANPDNTFAVLPNAFTVTVPP
jgi:hypothetical protein